MDILARLEELMAERGWSSYQLSKRSGLSQTTISAILKRNTCPSIPTLLAVCDGLGITAAEFFDPENRRRSLTLREKAILEKLYELPPSKRKRVEALIHGLIGLALTDEGE